MTQQNMCAGCGRVRVPKAGDKCGDCRDRERTGHLAEDAARARRTGSRSASKGRSKDVKRKGRGR